MILYRGAVVERSACIRTDWSLLRTLTLDGWYRAEAWAWATFLTDGNTLITARTEEISRRPAHRTIITVCAERYLPTDG